MNDKRTSPSTQSIFVIPIGDEVELYLEYNGLQWSNDSINEEKLRSFSENCQGIQITFLDAENGKLLLFSQKEDMEDSIKIYFERILSEQLPCAFFDKVSKTYDNFEVSSQVMQMTVCFMEDGKIDVAWQYEEDEIIPKDILIYICNDAFNFLYSALVDFPNCACPKCSCHEYISDKCRGEHFVRSRYAPAHYSNYVENISDFYTLLRRYIGIVFILLFQRHNHSDFIALKIC